MEISELENKVFNGDSLVSISNNYNYFVVYIKNKLLFLF